MGKQLNQNLQIISIIVPVFLIVSVVSDYQQPQTLSQWDFYCDELVLFLYGNGTAVKFDLSLCAGLVFRGISLCSLLTHSLRLLLSSCLPPS